ncbi:MAG TPA: peptidoglycan-binding protein [Candidatus Limiplasma sp.]|nr:peptidoglycan-binding protein [Candidatus Limiplasma sp.]
MKSKAHRYAMRALTLALLFVFLGTTGAMALTLYQTLEYGDTGTDVQKLQQALLTLGFDPKGVDGRFGTGTEDAVKKYQESVGLTADGKAGTLTLNALYKSAETPTTTFPTATSSSTLQYGDSGERVRLLQEALKKLGYTVGTVDGKFGLLTRSAVVAFQRSKGLTTDGLAGTSTLEQLYSSANSSDSSQATSQPTASPSLSASLRKGSSGSEVLAVQKKLKELGYYTNSLDGDYGNGTLAAVQAFQSRNNLKADGIVGSGTYGVLFSGSAIAANTSSSPTATNTPTETPSSASLRYGDTGSAVKTMQQALKNLGYSVSTDGVYGVITQTAVIAFQRKNSLTADGVAGAKTLEKLYSGSAVPYGGTATATPGATATPAPTTIPSTELTDTTSTSSNSGLSSAGYGSISGPGGVTVKPLYWYTEVKPNMSTGSTLTVYDPATDLTWKLRVYSRGRHADSEPLTAEDTATMYEAFGTITWDPKPVYVKLPNGQWTLATMHDVAHLSGSISDNDFDGHLCVHFLRTYAETKILDPNYGVTNQNVIRNYWKSKTGISIP